MTLGAIVNLPRLGIVVPIVLVVTLILALVAIFIAAWVRVPSETFLPPSVGWAIRYAEHYRDASEPRFLAQWHLACEGMRLAVRAKAEGVKRATWWAGASLASLAFAFIIAIGTIAGDSPSSGETVPHPEKSQWSRHKPYLRLQHPNPQQVHRLRRQFKRKTLKVPILKQTGMLVRHSRPNLSLFSSLKAK